ncbi:DUF2515 family protein [Alkalihalobacillus sp. AL-G]|uniref:DUF2515 family protein n=1 Tax=Alkalihalobacillus sp. AL-G TaxID=2926399 RepID=UPI00272D72DE|nr:DUF2515 family protein [Alkalihalobacillus sp. AL-G]WLD91785.1 DUF2515 domain-containing protein [Alkalihalobacillus sp. AL-G]
MWNKSALKLFVKPNESNLTQDEKHLIVTIQKKTTKWNVDNISRTKAYHNFYEQNPEISWSFLASMVSRNAGWNMCDLHSPEYRTLLSVKKRRLLFETYERANWLIFSDAYPQLLLYEVSKKCNTPLFHLLKAFQVSSFMGREWERLWNKRNYERINTCLIVNEQQLIQKPVLERTLYKERVFHSLPFWVQDRFHFSTVLFPTVEGDLFGLSVHGFRKAKKRILLGRRLLKLLFHPAYHQRFSSFASNTEPTGARSEYERFLKIGRKGHMAALRTLYPIIRHQREYDEDWSLKKSFTNLRFQEISLPDKVHLNDWYAHKRSELHLLAFLKSKIQS